MLAAGMIVGLGTDGASSNNNLDMFLEMRMAALIHKGIANDLLLPGGGLEMALPRAELFSWRMWAVSRRMKANITVELNQVHLSPVTTPVLPLPMRQGQ